MTKKGITNKEKLTIVMLSLADFMNFCSMSQMSPFFPIKATKIGMEESISGLIFGSYSMSIIITSPIAGKILPKLGMKRIFTSGLIIQGIANICFGLLDYLDNYYYFTGLSFLMRVAQGMGTSFYATGSFVIITKLFPDNGGFVRGILEVFVGLGLSIGPVIGGYLYHLGGFQLPFFVIGGTILIAIPFNTVFVPECEYKKDDAIVDKKRSLSIANFFIIPYVLMSLINLVTILVTWSSLNPTLEPYFRKFDIPVTTVSLIFLIFSVMYLISSPTSGWVSDKINNYWILMVVGEILTGVATLLLSFSKYIFNGMTLWWDITCIGFLGLFVGLAVIPTYKGVLDGALYYGKFENNIETVSLVSGLWISMYAVGGTIGPSLGGLIYSNLGFTYMGLYLGASNIVIGLLGFGYYVNNMHAEKRKSTENNDVKVFTVSKFTAVPFV